MLQAVLFDLDDTLLDNDMDVFLPRYLELLAASVSSRVRPGAFVEALMASARAMMENADPELVNDAVFWHHMKLRLELEQDELERFFAHFFATELDKLRSLTRPVPGARKAIQTCVDRGWSVVIATNPVFPRAAIDARLAWAGVGDLPFHSVTSYENSHFTKPRIEYYAEILERLACPPGQALMVGNDIDQDMKPARSLGMQLFKIRTGRNVDQTLPGLTEGSLHDLDRWLAHLPETAQG
jgi:FMN phosphatase YigB (HAD superfamily)